MRFKNKWLNRMTAAVLSIGMALTPAMMNSSVTYADVKTIESPIPVTQSEKAANLLKKTVVLSGSDYEISAEINATQMDIKVADSLNLSITLTAIPGDETSSNAIKTALDTVEWTVDNEDVLSIQNVRTGDDRISEVEIYALKTGAALVTGKVMIGGKSFECTCSMNVEKRHWDIGLEKNSMNLQAGGKNGKLTAYTYGNYGDPEAEALLKQAKFSWSSSDNNVAEVVGNGLNARVIPKKVGEAVITVAMAIPTCATIESTCTVTVEERDPSVEIGPDISLNQSKVILININGSEDRTTLKAMPEDREYEWKISDDEILHAWAQGNTLDVYDGSKAGTATITVTDVETNKSASCEVNVIDIDFPTFTTRWIEEDQTIKLDYNVQPEDTDVFQYITITSENTENVDIIDNATIKGIKKGATALKIRKKNTGESLRKAHIIVASKGQKVTEDENGFWIDPEVDDIKNISDPDGYLKSLEEYELEYLMGHTFAQVVNDWDSNIEVWDLAENLGKSVKLPLKDNERAVVYIDSWLTNAEFKAVSSSELYPTRLRFDTELYANKYDASTGLRIGEGDVDSIENKYLTGDVIRFKHPIPSNITEKYAQIVLKSEGYEDEIISDLEIKHVKEENGDGEIVASAYIEIPVTHFGTFDVTFTNEKVKTDDNDENTGDNTGSGSSGNAGSNTGSSSGGSSSGSGSGSSRGGSSRSYTYSGTKKAAKWGQDAKGWKFQNADGSYVTNRWIELSWGEKSAWYRFNEQGYMMTGWFKDADNNWYFMNDRADGIQGSMVTGWRQIAGKWYYFRVTAGGPKGSLVVNATTPDGYKVDGNGAWIQ